MAWPVWIAKPFARWASRLAAPFIIGGAIALALMGIKRSARKNGQKEERLKARADTAEAAAQEGLDNADRLQKMSDARADGPNQRNDIIERLRDGDT